LLTTRLYPFFIDSKVLGCGRDQPENLHKKCMITAMLAEGRTYFDRHSNNRVIISARVMSGVIACSITIV
jgi:hypothetical protein